MIRFVHLRLPRTSFEASVRQDNSPRQFTKTYEISISSYNHGDSYQIEPMSLSISLNLFKNIPSQRHICNNRHFIRFLYKLVTADVESTWICSYRNYSSSNYEFGQGYSIPNYLEFSGLLVSGATSNFDTTEIDKYNTRNIILDQFYLLLLDMGDEDVLLTESLTCWIVSRQDGSYKKDLINPDSLTLIECDRSELARRDLSLIGVSHKVMVPITLGDEVSFDTDMLGLKSFVDLPLHIRKTIIDSLRSEWPCGRETEHCKDGDFYFLVYDNFTSEKKKKNGHMFGLHNLGIGLQDGHRHVLVKRNIEGLDKGAFVQILIQTTVLLPSKFVNVNVSEEGSREILKALHAFIHTTCRAMESVSFPLYCYITNEVFEFSGDSPFYAKESTKKAEKSYVNVSMRHNRLKDKFVDRELFERDKPVKVHPLKNNDIYETPIVKKLSLAVASGSISFDANFTVNFNEHTGGIRFIAYKTNDEEKEVNMSKIGINMCFKTFINDTEQQKCLSLPFGGISLPLFNLSNNSMDGALRGVLNEVNPITHLKFLVNPIDLIDRDVMISPHHKVGLFPRWMDSRRSKTFLVDGEYQYYHYKQGNINDSGWGCCYRSIQLISSWYLLNYYTVKCVPSHNEIQEILKKNDHSHKDLVIGSPTWIGTVEAGYFINWYLNYNSKTLHLSGVSDLKDFSELIVDHFIKQGTPIIIGAGLFAYVLLGICIGHQPDGVAYLIADPHYTGDDTIKGIQSKGAVAWKKVLFISHYNPIKISLRWISLRKLPVGVFLICAALSWIYMNSGQMIL